MFQFPAFASYPYVFRIRYLITILGNHLSPLDHPEANDPAKMISQVSKVGFPIRISTDQRVFAPPRSFSQRITSFIACACQGIHQLPLRHLIILIANAHPDCSRTTLAEKTSFSRSVRWPAVKPPIILEGIERSPPTHPHRMIKPKKPKPFSNHAGAMSEQIFSSQCQTEQAASEPAANLFLLLTDNLLPTAHTINCLRKASAKGRRWWSWTGSNRRPPACKAGALPAELQPLVTHHAKRKWWAWIDSNYRPHPYQGCALTT